MMEKKDYRVFCENKDHFNDIVDIVSQNINNVIDKCVINDDEKEKGKKRFLEVFKNLLNENITFTSDLDSIHYINNDSNKIDSTEVNVYLNKTLLPKVGDVLVETTRKRKLYPEKYRELVTKQFKLEAEKLKSQQYHVEGRINLKEFPKYTYTDGEKLMTAVSSEIKKFIQTIPEKVDKIKQFEESYNVSRKIGECKTDQTIFRENILQFNG